MERVKMSRTQHMQNAGAAMDGYSGKTTGQSLRFRELLGQLVGK